MTAEEVTSEVSEETKTKRGPWVIVITLAIGSALFALICNPTFAAWVSGAGS